MLTMRKTDFKGEKLRLLSRVLGQVERCKKIDKSRREKIQELSTEMKKIYFQVSFNFFLILYNYCLECLVPLIFERWVGGF